MSIKSSVIFTFCLLLFIYAISAIACDCDPPCGECESCQDGECVSVPYMCPNWPCEICSGGMCKCNSECCEDSDCGPPGCWNCVDCYCEWDCGAGSCCGGSCCSNTCCNNVCCSAGQNCCDGSCCDKVWTKETHTAINESCPSVAECYEPGVGCDGVSVTVRPSYDSCLNVEVGTGEHCECNEEEQVVGYDYTCQEDWDWSMMASCAFEAALCFFQCVGAYADPASCADCLGMLELDCCGGDTCHICVFLESCDPLYPEEIKKNVFTDFGDCQ